MPGIAAVYDNGVFRPKEPVFIPEGTDVQLVFVSRQVPGPDGQIGSDMDPDSPEYQAYLDRMREIMSPCHDDAGGPPTNILETHNEHQP